MKFYIKRISGEERYKDGLPIYGTGSDVFSAEKAERFSEKIDDDTIQYTTGFSDNDIKRSPLLNAEEKEACIKNLKKAKEALEEAYTEKALDPTNNGFWGKRDRRFLDLNEKFFNLVFDDNDIDALILKQAILSNAFPQIAYKESDKYKLPGKKYYMVELEELEQKNYQKAHGSKLEAMAKLHEIKTKKGKDIMLYLTYFLSDSLDKGFTRGNSLTSLETYLIEYIEGKNVKRNKKKCASDFLNACLEYENNKDEFMAVVTYRVAKHFNLIYNLKGKVHVRSNKMELGTDEKSSIKILLQPTNAEELMKLHTEADAKLDK